MGPLSNEEKVRCIEESKIRTIRALRLALTALHDAHNDIDVISPSVYPGPKEVRDAQIRAWNIVGRLLVEASKSIKAYLKDDVLGEAGLSGVIVECEKILQIKAEEDSEEILGPLREQIRKIMEERSRKRKPGN